MDPRTAHPLLEAEVARFETWFLKQQERGVLAPSPLASIERGAILSYLYYAASAREP